MNKPQLHPLRLAYIKAIKRIYGAYVNGDKDPSKTEQAARKINALGLDYECYVDLAVRMLGSTAKHYNWPYPYWNAVIGDKTLDKVKKLSDLVPGSTSINDNPDEDVLFEEELSYATAYVDWWFGRGDKPDHCGEVPSGVRVKVAEYLCRLWGLPNISSNYNLICKALERHGC